MIDSRTPILLVDDDEVDQEAIRRAIGKAGIDLPLRIANDGLEGLEMLRGENGHEALHSPCLILLDLNMPRMNGFEFLEALRADPGLRTSIVFVLSTSDRDEDMMRAYDLQVAGYMTKSTVAQDVGLLTRLLQSYRRLLEMPLPATG